VICATSQINFEHQIQDVIWLYLFVATPQEAPRPFSSGKLSYPR
jgi:hypothetical protein